MLPTLCTCVDVFWPASSSFGLSRAHVHHRYARLWCGTLLCVLLFHGWLLVLAGTLSYLTATDVTPAMATAQKIGTVQGALLVGAAGSWHLLTLSRSNHRLVRLLLLLYVWANWIGAQLALVTGASGNVYDRSFTCSLTNTKWMYAYGVESECGLLDARRESRVHLRRHA